MHSSLHEDTDIGADAAESSDGPVGASDMAQPSSRRKFFFLGALAVASGVAPRAAAAQIVPKKLQRHRVAVPGDPFPTVVAGETTAPPVTWTSPVVRLVRRATLGLTSDEVARARLMGYQAWLNSQVNYTRINDDLVDTYVAGRWPIVNQPPEDIYDLDFSLVVNSLREATIYRAAFSRRQLYERMVEFWSDHFNVAVDKVGYLKVMDDREVIRQHALGSFTDLVMASAKSAAMLAYLDQNISRVGRPNENYARELMELHTLGVDGGYSQDDVVQLARVLTGWTVQGRGRFAFDPTGHDWGAKTVLGVTIPASSPSVGADGVKEGEQIIRMLVEHPNTARYIATKLLKWLLTPEPSESQIKTVAAVFRATGGDIKLMVRAILNSGWLAASPVKLKRPFHFLVSGLRATNPSVTGTNTMNSQLNAMGHLSFDWETPDGYPDRIDYWAGNIITRWSAATALANSNTATLAIDISPYSGSPSVIVDAIDEHFFGAEMTASTRAALVSFLGTGTLNETRIREALALAMSSPGFQWY